MAAHDDQEVIKKLDKLSSELADAKTATEKTIKKVKQAQAIADAAKRAVRVHQHPDYSKPKRKRQTHR